MQLFTNLHHCECATISHTHTYMAYLEDINFRIIEHLKA